MPGKKQLSQNVKEAIAVAKKDGLSKNQLASAFGISKSTVKRISRKFAKTKAVERAPGSGRPRKSTARDDRALAKIVKDDPKKTASDVRKYANNNLNLGITTRTARNILKRADLEAYRPSKKPLISKKNIKARLEFARNHLGWSVADWGRVLWSDESKFNLLSSDGIRYVRRPQGQRNNPKYQVPTVKHGGGSVMVWGSFSRDGVGPLVRIEGIMKAVDYKNILEQNMLPDARNRLAEDWIFQQDNDPKHASKLLKKWFTDNEVDVLKWPSQSPDLNPIEHLWEVLDKRIRARNFTKTGAMYDVLAEEWSNMPLNVLVKLVDSMPRRCQAVIDAKGYATKY